MKFLAYDKWSEDQYVYRSRVLKEDSVGCGRMLCCPDEKKKKDGVDERSSNSKKIYLQTVSPGQNQNGDPREQRPKKRDLIGIKRCELDKQPAGAPEEN